MSIANQDWFIEQIREAEAKPLVDALCTWMDTRNDYINDNGKIEDSTIIKVFHTYENRDWINILIGTKRMLLDSNFYLPGCQDDVDFLINHMHEYSQSYDNCLFPRLKVEAKWPEYVTHKNRAKRKCTIKSRVHKLMMALAEALNEACGIDLPNKDSSKGNLNPTQYQMLFHGI